MLNDLFSSDRFAITGSVDAIRPSIFSFISFEETLDSSLLRCCSSITQSEIPSVMKCWSDFPPISFFTWSVWWSSNYFANKLAFEWNPLNCNCDHFSNSLPNYAKLLCLRPASTFCLFSVRDTDCLSFPPEPDHFSKFSTVHSVHTKLYPIINVCCIAELLVQNSCL